MFAASKSGRKVVVATDPYFPYVPLLLETTSTNGQQNNTFLDSSTNNFTITRNGTPTQGSVTPYWPDGYWSNYFNGTSSYLTTPDTAALQLGTGDFTIEAWVYVTGGTTDFFIISATGSGGLFFGYNNSTTSWGWGRTAITWDYTTTGATKALNTWQHIAIARSGTAMKLYINGTPIGAGLTTSQSYSLSTTSCAIGSQGAIYYFPGNISNLRVIKGQALITGSGGFTVPTAPLTLGAVGWSGTNVASSISGIVSLLTCQSNRFKDNSTSPLTLTLNGIPSTVAFQPFPPLASYTTAAYGGSSYNGTKTDVVTATSVAAITTFTGDFTFECWVYPTDTSQSTWGILDTRTAGQTATSWVWSLTNYISSPVGWVLQFYNGSANSFGIRVPPNTWSHVVLQRNGTTVRSFVNGVVDTITFTISGTITGGSSTVYISNTKDNALAGYGNIGYTSNLRMVNGTAVYTTTGFTPPTAPVTAITNTSLLVNATNAGIYDAAVQNNGVTVGSAQASTTQSKWSPTSMSFNGTTDYLTMPVSPGFSFGTGNFTIEAWIYNTSSASTSKNIFSNWGGASESYQFYLRTNNRLVWQVNNQNSPDTAALAVSVNAWNHVAWTRSSSTAYLHINGVLQDTTSLTNSANGGEIPRVGAGQSGTQLFSGYIQDLRVTKGIARYGATNFTPPTAAFPTR
jgi:hypothetical protein